MKILIMTSSGEPLNSIRPEAEIFIGLHGEGNTVTVMTGRDNVYWDRWVGAGMEMVAYEPRKRLSVADVRHMRRYLKTHLPDVVYLFNNKSICNTAFAAIGLPPVLVAYRGQTGNIRWYDPSCYLTILHPRIDAVSCVANAVRDDLRRQVRRPERVVTLYKGHDVDWYADAPADLSFLSLPEDAFVVGCTANNRPRKGIPVLVEAMGHIPESAHVVLLLIGNGMGDPDLDRQIRRSPAVKRIYRLGFRNDAPALAAACGCTVLPALKREGLPKTVIESMAHEVPPIVTDTGGSGELVEDGVSGFVVPAADAGAIADRILWLSEHPEESKAMGRAARRRIQEKFNVEKSIEQTGEMFRIWMEEKHLDRSR